MKKITKIDLLRLESKGFISQDGSRQGINEQFRSIKRTLLKSMNLPKKVDGEKSQNMIMITSVRSNEGKTFNAINLALSVAFEKDKTVLLVDSDVINPSVNKVLDFEVEKGIVEYLRGDFDDIGDAILHTNIKNLKIIPAGKPSNLTNELLASDRMKNLTEELSERYSDRVIIFDSPPLLGITETPIIANLMGQAVIIVEENVTSLSELKAATKDLSPTLPVGVIINKSTRTNKSTYLANDYNNYNGVNKS
jgi:protein-tyrosine kinase